MRKLSLVLASLLSIAAILIPASLASGESTITVHLRADASITFPFSEPAFVATCDVVVPAGSTGLNVLESASCVDEITVKNFPCCGNYLSAVKGPNQNSPTDERLDKCVEWIVGVASWWMVLVNGVPSNIGIDHPMADGDDFEVDYQVVDCTTWSEPDVDSPVPLSGPL